MLSHLNQVVTDTGERFDLVEPPIFNLFQYDELRYGPDRVEDEPKPFVSPRLRRQLDMGDSEQRR